MFNGVPINLPLSVNIITTATSGRLKWTIDRNSSIKLKNVEPYFLFMKKVSKYFLALGKKTNCST